MTDREVMKQALEALENCVGDSLLGGKQRQAAIPALRAQLAQPDRQTLQAAGTHPAPCARHCEAKAFEIEIRSLKSALKQQAEPVAWMDRDGDLYSMPVVENWSPPHTLLYTSPPQCKPLTDEEIEAAFLKCNGKWDGDQWVIEDADFHPFARAIEAAHGIGEKP